MLESSIKACWWTKYNINQTKKYFFFKYHNRRFFLQHRPKWHWFLKFSSTLLTFWSKSIKYFFLPAINTVHCAVCTCLPDVLMCYCICRDPFRLQLAFIASYGPVLVILQGWAGRIIGKKGGCICLNQRSRKQTILREAIKKITIESVIMILPCRTPLPFFLTLIALGFFFLSQFSDHLGSQVHPETNFGKFFGKIWAKQRKYHT